MNLDELKDIAHKMMGKRKAHKERETGFIYYHGQRVASLALELRREIIPNDSQYDDVITVASWFHDIGKGIEPHWTYGAVIAEKLLSDHCSSQELARIVEIIAHHPLRKQQDYPDYVRLVQDADILDHFGSLDIWLNFQYSAAHDAAVERSLEFYEKEFAKHIERVRPLLNYPVSFDAFDEKIAFTREFVNRLRVEAAGRIFVRTEDDGDCPS